MGYRKVALNEAVGNLRASWTQLKMGSVENYDVKVAVYEGEYHRHKHANHDEFIYVLKGRIEIEIDGDEVALSAGEGIFIPKGTAHRPRCEGRAEVILFEKNTIMEDHIRV